MSEYFDQILTQAKQASFDMAKLSANDRSKDFNEHLWIFSCSQTRNLTGQPN
jgi:hypothetical protein